MTPSEIQTWRPRRFADVIGAANSAAVERLRTAARRRDLFKPLLVGPVGTAKTSLARLLQSSYCCARPDAATGDPCLECGGCRGCHLGANGGGDPYQHWAFNCGESVDKATVAAFVRAHKFRDCNAVLFDELGDLPEPAQKALLGYLHDLKGGLFAATLTSEAADRHHERLVKPLADRLEPVELSAPTAVELVEFFAERVREWRLRAERDTLALLVRATGGSFRQCLLKLAAAAGRDDRTLGRDLFAAAFLVPTEEPAPEPSGPAADSAALFSGDGW